MARRRGNQRSSRRSSPNAGMFGKLGGFGRNTMNNDQAADVQTFIQQKGGSSNSQGNAGRQWIVLAQMVSTGRAPSPGGNQNGRKLSAAEVRRATALRNIVESNSPS